MTASIQSAVFERMVALRRDLHRHPELSGREHRTTERIIQELDRLGIPHYRPLETGVVADIDGPRSVPAVAFRADIDALPIREETGGARALTDAGALQGVDAVFGGHVDGNLPTGVIAVAEGTVNASSDSFRISIQGRKGHAARPHETVDAVVVGSLIVMAVQTIVSREIDPSQRSLAAPPDESALTGGAR